MSDQLTEQLTAICTEAALEAAAVSVYDLDSGRSYSWKGDQWLHAASTFKAGVLLALLKAAEGDIRLEDHLQVRNRFVSIATGEPFRIARDRDGDGGTHARVGQSLTLHQLGKVMITRSSNLATNLLLDFLGVERVQAILHEGRLEGLAIRRGVEDLAAHEAGINNEATADGLRGLFRCFLEDGVLREDSREKALEILHAQEFNRMLPARLPKGVRVAHKTGEISTHCHDAGIVFPPERPPYVVAILTQTSQETENRQRAVAAMSEAVYRWAVKEGA